MRGISAINSVEKHFKPYSFDSLEMPFTYPVDGGIKWIAQVGMYAL